MDGTRKNGDRPSTSDASPTELDAIQRLLGLFLFLNVCQLLGIIGLWYLDRRRKRQAALLAHRVSVSNLADEDSEDVDPTGVESPKDRRRRSLLAKERVSESHSLQRRDSISEYATVSRIDEAMSESLLGRSSSRLLDSEEEEERPLLDDEPLEGHGGSDEPVAGEALTKAEHVRGEAFGVMGICLIAFAWVFFLWTAFLRLRSKRDRDGT